jgi:F0F1-type ATP synthase membrane subunit a
VSVIFTHLYAVCVASVLSKVTQCSLSEVTQANVTVVSAKLVVKSQGAIVAVAFGSTNVPLGLPALSVSILIHKSTDGLTTFAKLSFSVVPAVQLPIPLILALVFQFTSPISWSVVACANVTGSSLNKLSQSAIVSQAR